MGSHAGICSPRPALWGREIVAESTPTQPTKEQINRWRQYLADERAEAALYFDLAQKRTGEERQILLDIGHAERRHEEYWRNRLGEYVGMPKSPSMRIRLLGFLANNFGNVFVLALLQSAETDSPYALDNDATQEMAADESIHAEVVRALATKGREKMSGGFRAAIFGANDGLVSNLALVLGVIGSGVGSNTIVITGFAGMLAGALSMAAGEFISVSSQRELLAASRPDQKAATYIPQLDVDANELALVYRARGLSREEAQEKAEAALAHLTAAAAVDSDAELVAEAEGIIEDNGSTVADQPVFDHDHEASQRSEDAVGSAFTAAWSSFAFFASGALIPLIPFVLGADVLPGMIIACVLVGITLLVTGGIVGLLSGAAPGKRALRQLVVGLLAAAVTYGLGSAVGAVM